MASGLNRVKRLQALDIEIKDDRASTKMALSQLTIPTTGVLAHPRADRPVSQALVDNIVEEGGILKPLKVWEQTDKEGKPVFLIVDGSRRKKAGHEAEKILQKTGKLAEDGELWVKVDFFEGTEIDFLLARQEADGDPLKEPHSPSVIAVTFIQILKIDPEYPIDDVRDKDGNIVRTGLRSTVSKEYANPRIIEALTRWKSLPKDVQDAFDNGIEIEGVVRPVSIGLLPAMDKVSKEEKFDFLTELVAGGYKTFAGATRLANTKAFEEQMAADVADEPDDTPPAPVANGKDRAASSSSSSASSFMVRKSMCKKAYEQVVAKKAPPNVIAFAAGAAFLQGLEIDTAGYPEKLLAFIEGGCWQRGVPGVKVPPEIKEALVKAPKEPKAPKAPKDKKSKRKKSKKSKGEDATT
jgi:hypothetical protein